MRDYNVFMLKNIKILHIFLVLMLIFAGSASASNGRGGAEEGGGRTVRIPRDAEQISENVYRLRPTRDRETDLMVEGYLIVHYRENEGAARRTAFSHRSNNARQKQESCYGFMASGAKWKTIEPWVVNPANTYGLTDSFVLATLANGIAKWEDAADGFVGNGGSIDILGNGVTTSTPLVADEIQTDNLNEVYFAPLEEGTIGVTIVWGVFRGPTFQRRLVEWDQVYNSFYSWGGEGEADKMDLDNIVTHELGHSVGMADLYSTSCAEETMFGYATEGEIKKRNLNTGDIKGVSTLY